MVGKITEMNHIQSLKKFHPELTKFPSVQVLLAIEGHMVTLNFKGVVYRCVILPFNTKEETHNISQQLYDNCKLFSKFCLANNPDMNLDVLNLLCTYVKVPRGYTLRSGVITSWGYGHFNFPRN